MPFAVGRILYDSTPGCVTWRVENFFSHPQDRDGYFIASPSFSALDANWWFWLDLSVNVDGTSRTQLILYMCTSVAARFKFGIRGRDNAELMAYSGETRDMGQDGVVGLIQLPVHWRQYKEVFAPGGVLSVFCRLRERGAPRRPSATPENDTSTQTKDIGPVCHNCAEVPSKSCSSPENDTSTQTDDFGPVCHNCADGPSKSCSSPGALKVLENLKELLSTEEACDVTLKVQNQEFKAHKALLIARSSVFRAMFCHKMSEKLSNEVNITDCDPDAFRIFLKHAYTGDAEDLTMTNAINVFFVANKYDDAELKILCKVCIASNITVENVCDVVAFSLLHGDSVLLEKASEFFTTHISQILLTNEWQCFLREHPTPANELLIRATKFCVRPQ